MYESMLIIKLFYLIILLLDINIPRSFVYQYETNSSSSPVRSLSEQNTQQPVYVSLESNSPYQFETFKTAKSITPSFQRKFPFVSVAILGFFELISGLIVLGLEFIIFDIALGLWCGGIYALAGAAIVVLGLFKKQKIV
jgi:type IV secretory pathway VirB6-like protein